MKEKIMKNLVFLVILSLSIFSCKVIAWEEKSTDDYWTSYYGSWNAGGQRWDSELAAGSYYVGLEPYDNWQLGYRPSKMRISWLGGASSLNINVYDTDDEKIFTGTITSGVEFPLTFSSLNIYAIELVGSSSYSITKIEFYFFSYAVNGAALSGATLQ